MIASRRTRWAFPTLLAAVSLVATGCGGGVDATYGRSRGPSVNGTGALAEMFREKGHDVRVALRLNDDLKDKVDTIVRFAQRPGTPDREEAAWYQKWLAADARRRLVYIPRDFDAESEYWAGALAAMPANTKPATRKKAEERRREAESWPAELPAKPREQADADDWFDVTKAAGAVTCQTLGGPWAVGIDPVAAAVVRHEGLRAYGEIVLLSGDGVPLALQWHWPGDPAPNPGAATLVVAGGSFLLNEPLVHRARRPLAARVVDWIGPEPRKVAFVEGYTVTSSDKQKSSSPFDLFKVAPVGFILAHWVAALLLLALSRGMILGRPRDDPPADADRPSAHPQALGVLLARTRDAVAARAILETYHRWRQPSATPHKTRGPRP